MYQDTFQQLKSKMFLLTNSDDFFHNSGLIKLLYFCIVKSPLSYLLKVKSECIALSLLNIASYTKSIHKVCGYFYLDQIKPKVDPWQQKLLIKLKQWKKVDKLMDLHSKFVEVI